MKDSAELKGVERLTVISGAAGAIGSATARRFCQDGSAVLLVDRRADALARTADELRPDADAPVLTLDGDVGDAADVARIAAVCESAADAELVVVNNAAVLNERRPSVDLPATEWQRVLNVNLLAAVTITSATAPLMRARGGGCIVNVSSVAAGLCRDLEGPYSVAKAGLEGLTRNLAIELGPYGIRCNAVSPGLIMTPFLAKYSARFGHEIDKTPLRRFGNPDEVAAAIRFVASDEASFITGTTLNVSGGWYVQT